MREGLLIAAVVINSALLVGLLIVGVLVIRRLGETADAVKTVLNDIHEELPNTLNAATDTLQAVEKLAARTEEELLRVDDVLRSVDRLAAGASIADAAIKAVKSSRNTAVGIIAGVKEGLRVLKSPAEKPKEDHENV